MIELSNQPSNQVTKTHTDLVGDPWHTQPDTGNIKQPRIYGEHATSTKDLKIAQSPFPCQKSGSVWAIVTFIGQSETWDSSSLGYCQACLTQLILLKLTKHSQSNFEIILSSPMPWHLQVKREHNKIFYTAKIRVILGNYMVYTHLNLK